MSSWIDHVKQVALENDIPYKDAMEMASRTYRGSARKRTVRSKPRRSRGGCEGECNCNDNMYGSANNMRIRRSGSKTNAPRPNMDMRAFRLGQQVGDIIGGAQDNKGALAALLSGLDARINIK